MQPRKSVGVGPGDPEWGSGDGDTTMEVALWQQWLFHAEEELLAQRKKGREAQQSASNAPDNMETQIMMQVGCHAFIVSAVEGWLYRWHGGLCMFRAGRNRLVLPQRMVMQQLGRQWSLQQLPRWCLQLPRWSLQQLRWWSLQVEPATTTSVEPRTTATDMAEDIRLHVSTVCHGM